jgi:hypothetical protein
LLPLADDPEALRRLVLASGRNAPLGTLGKLIDPVRERESGQQDPDRRAEWTALRGVIHQALSARGSRLGVYDLRESFEGTRGPLPVGFVAAVTAVGDASCLEPIAAAYERSTGSADSWWRPHLKDAFAAILLRERLTKRHAAVRRILARWPAIANKPSRSAPSPSRAGRI